MDAPGLLPSAPALRPLRRISPSHHSSIEECGLREAWGATWRPPLLPSAPSAYLGSVIHALLESAGKGELYNAIPAAIEQRWAELLGNAETAMARSWTARPLQPLRLSVPDFEVCVL